jgi:DNA invertase Pin-like site-specific DNA recombinase
VAFVSVTEALDLTTPAGRAMATMVAVFAQFEREILKERVKAGITQAQAKGKPMGRPTTARPRQEEVRALHAAGVS